jgi:3-oxoacyl-[acyl-carrier protein] reductase
MRLGAQVCVWDIDVDSAKKAVGEKAKFMKVDALDHKAVKSATEEAIKEMGGIDILVGTVGGGRVSVMLPDMDADTFWSEVAFTGLSMFICAQSVLGHFMGKGEGKMLFFTSATGGVPGLTGYGAGKAVLESVMKSIQAETGGTKISVNAILPGIVGTKLTKGFFESQGMDGKEMLTALGAANPRGLNTPEEVAGVALFLLSSEGDRLKGQILMMD